MLAGLRRRWWLLRRPSIEKLAGRIAAVGRKDGRAATAVVDKLSQRDLDQLVERDAGRSIAELHRRLRELRRVDEALLAAFERKLGARRYLDLILEAGTLVELFRGLRHSTPAMARRVVALMSAEDVERLHRRTAASEHSIGTLGVALRALAWADEQLFEALEEKVAERRYLDLVLRSGTIFELLRFLGYLPPASARRLLAALKAPDVERLLARTAASGRSLGAFTLRLRKLALVDEQRVMTVIEKVGVQRWWRLVLACGNLRELIGVARYASRDFEQQLLATLQTAPADELEPWLLRSDLLQICRLLRWRSASMVSAVPRGLFERLRPTFETLLERADWTTRARAAYQLAHAPPLPLMNAMTSLVWDRLEEVEPPVPEGEEMRTFLHCARHLVAADPGLSSQGSVLVDRHLGPPDGWPSVPGFLRWGRDLLRMACEPETDPATAGEWLRAACRPEVALLVAEATTLDVFLYFWNLFGLWFQWREETSEELRERVAEALSAEALRAFVERSAIPADEQELRHQLALAGVLKFTGLAEEAELAARGPDRWPEPERLAAMLVNGTFVPSALVVLGYEASLGRRCDAALRQDVAGRLSRHPAPTAAMRFLHLWMRL